MDFFYNTAFGRLILNVMLHAKVLNLLVRTLHTSISALFIKPYIRKHNIDMLPYGNQRYKSFADFFVRKKPGNLHNADKNALISPCDGMLSIVPIDDGAYFNVKGINYSMKNLITDKELADSFKDGLCLIFRLQAKDYHHFCHIDDCFHTEGHFIEGKLHSVQPVALEKEPVFRLNRRMWSVMDTENFGKVVQIEVGAVFVGGIVLDTENMHVKRGDEMGRFELCGSTILLFINKDIRERLVFNNNVQAYIDKSEECPVKMGYAVGYLK